MTRVDLPYLWIKDAFSVYYRRGGKTVRIRGRDGKPLHVGGAGFLDAYNRLHRAHEPEQSTPALQYSLTALTASYQRDEAWADLADATQKRYRRWFSLLNNLIGSADMRALDRQDVMAVRNKLAVSDAGERVPARANEAVVVLSLLCKHAIDLGWREFNPASGVKKLRAGDGHKRWTDADVQTLLNHPGVSEPVKRAVVLAYYTGLRLSDCARLPKGARRGGYLEAMPAKTARSTGAVVMIPEHPELTRWLDAAPRTDATTILTNASGRPWTPNHLSHEVTWAVRDAGLSGLSMHGLRKGLTSALAEAGASDAEIEAVIPHADGKLTKYYRAQADQRRLADAAVLKLTQRSR